MTITIDHQAFPQIIDLIVQYAPPGALLAQRAASKEFLHRINRLAEHAVLEKTSSALSPDSTAVAYDDGILYSCLSSPGRRMPPLPSAAKVLDLVLPTEYYDHDRLDRFTAIHTLRRIRGAWDLETLESFPTVRTVVDFIDFLPRYCPPQALRIPPGTSHYVAHVRYDQPEAGDLFAVCNEHVRNLDVDIVLWPTCPVDGNPLPPPLRLITLTINRILEYWTGDTMVTITIVGLDTIPSQKRGYSPNDLFKEILEVARGRHLDYSDHWLFNTELTETVRRSIRLKTLDEWWKGLGDRKDVEGVWPEIYAPVLPY
ncbi:uncharacterized protein LOC62_04G005340 [Vanrija pseudolonga]|uniref:Uncharacterized protein n=1 Tax=Vanrija pseudolonga TaxID=143232 RepID=A0AAF1BIQ1_9TREE|nr:hypothetical protein LOC62_04G005340 [Vanrija pseudolonga]